MKINRFAGLLALVLTAAIPSAFGQGVRIDQLPSATTPLGGTEVVPIMQGGVTKKALVSSIGGGAPGGAANTVQYKIDASTFGGVGPGTASQVLHGNPSGAPSFGAVSLTGDVTGTLPL